MDFGRMFMTPFSVLFAGLALFRVNSLLESKGWLQLVTTLLVVSFYALMIWLYLRRIPPRRTSTELLPASVALMGTFLPIFLPFAGVKVSETQALVGNVVLALGLSFSVWSLWCLKRSFSILAQARELVRSGPYSRIRHPLYTGEIIAMLGLTITLGSPLALGGWLLLVLAQSYRAFQEEKLLVEVFPEYREYQAATSRVLPGLY